MIGFYEVLALPPSPLRSGIQICVGKYKKTSGFTSENALSDATLEQNTLFGQKMSRRGPKSSPAGPHPPRKLLSRTAFHEENKKRPSPLRCKTQIQKKIVRKSTCFANEKPTRFHHSAAECSFGPLFRPKEGFCRRVAKQIRILTAFLRAKKASQGPKMPFRLCF